jgi:hypothetical protein
MYFQKEKIKRYDSPPKIIQHGWKNLDLLFDSKNAEAQKIGGFFLSLEDKEKEVRVRR